jgi:penicillin-binding protein 2
MAFYSKEERSKMAVGLFFLLVAVAIIRLFYLQVISHAAYTQVAEENYIRVVPLEAPRGLLYDHNGKLLVSNRPSYSIYFIPYQIKNPGEAFEDLSRKLNLSLAAPSQLLQGRSKSKYQPIRLLRDVEFKTICVLEENSLDLPGIIYQVERARKYPPRGRGSHLLGYVAEISEAELARSSHLGYRSGDLTGKRGVERQYDYLLRGQPGVSYLTVTALGRILGPASARQPVPPKPGADIKLTVDWELQSVAESLLASYGSGAAVAVDPKSGEILALVSQPNFDPNLFTGVVLDTVWERLASDSLHPLLNRCLQGTYPPGSSFKVFTAAAGLESGRVTTTTLFRPCRGGLAFGNRVFKCWRSQGHGQLTLIDAMAQSCDIYFYQLGEEIGLDLWSDYARRCPFGQLTGIDLPSELSGTVPSRAYFDEEYGEGKWPPTLIVNLAIGQGEVLVTPLQMAAFFAAIANGGEVFEPHLIREIKYPDGRLFRAQGELLGHLPFSPNTLGIIKAALVKAVNGERGTGRAAILRSATVAGKTGTAQNPHGEDHAWFCCFAPAEDPQVAIAIVVENAGHGGSVAAPIAREMMAAYLGGQPLPPGPEKALRTEGEDFW